jgi:hypothetical protein
MERRERKGACRGAELVRAQQVRDLVRGVGTEEKRRGRGGVFA